MSTQLRNKIILISGFAIAMGFLESAVVVYLRQIYYPEGFAFPIAPIDSIVAITEILREMATIIMLLAVGILAGKSVSERFSWFLYSFALWDIFYYVFLKTLLNWPESLLTWDILFLIPVTWVGPVISPVIVSFTMILLSYLILFYSDKAIRVKLGKQTWILLIVGSVVIIVSFVWDYSKFVISENSLSQLISIPQGEMLFDLTSKYIPHKFPWIVFIFGELLVLSGIANFFFNMRALYHHRK